MRKVRSIWRRIRCATAPDDSSALCRLVGLEPTETMELTVTATVYGVLTYEVKGTPR